MYLKYLQDLKDGKLEATTGGLTLGYQPPPVSFSDLRKDLPTWQPPPFFFADLFPRNYDLRELGKVTAVRNQDICLICWTFAAFGSLESYLSPLEVWDFSEHHMGNTTGFDGTTGQCGIGFGHPATAIAYLSRWSGPVDETDDPYLSDTSPVNPTVVKHVQEVLDLPVEGSYLNMFFWLKFAIMEYGAVAAMMMLDETIMDKVNNTYYQNHVSYENHGVTIVGWDDDIEADKFPLGADGNPPGDGAWIVKNSYGDSWGEDGYFYVSYNDAVLGKKNCYVFTAEPADNYDRIYQYDPLGRISFFYLNLPNQSEKIMNSANVFTAVDYENLVAVSFYTVVPRVLADIEIHLDPPDNAPVGYNSPVLQMTGKEILIPGYHTVKLSQSISLSPGQRYSVVIKSYYYDLYGNTTKEPVIIEYPTTKQRSSNATANPGESFVRQGQSDWFDLTTLEIEEYDGTIVPLTNANVCIKAFTTLKKATFLGDSWIVKDKHSLAWSVVNDTVQDLLIKPVAVFYRKNTNLPGNPPGFHQVGATTGGAFYVDEDNVKHKVGNKDGWINIPKGKSITVHSRQQVPSVANWVSYNAYINQNGVDSLISNNWRYRKIYKNNLKVVSSNPVNGGLLDPESTISVTFDKDSISGPGMHKINLSSDFINLQVFSKVDGNRLLIYPEAELDSLDLPNEVQWTITVPKDAVANLDGQPLEKEFSTTFIVKRELNKDLSITE